MEMGTEFPRSMRGVRDLTDYFPFVAALSPRKARQKEND